MSGLSRRRLLGGAALLASIGCASFAAEAASGTGNRVGLKGYDPVSYFTKGRPEKGSPEFFASFDGATYWFTSVEHRDRFVADPDHYAPQFRGFSAIGLSHGEKYEADPEAWAIRDGKLYVFAAKEGVPIFQRQPTETIAEARRHWSELRETP